MRKHGPRIGLLQSNQQPFAEYDILRSEWRIWVSFVPDMSSGSYYTLSSTGLCELYTVNNGHILSVVRITDHVKRSDMGLDIVMKQIINNK